MAQTALSYYTTQADHGNYQFTPLSEIIDTVLAEIQSDPDHYLKNTSRALVILNAKRGIKDLTFDMANDVLALELEIGDDLQFIFPQDYVDWVRVSVVGEDKKLYPLDINEKSNRAKTYLQDHKFKILFDHEGDELEADGNNVYNFPIQRDIYSTHTPQFQKDTSKLSRYGEFSIDKRRGVFSFDSSLAGKSIVIEYISDGLQWEEIDEEEITVHKYFEEPLNNWIYWKGILRNRHVPMNEKIRAERAYYGAKSKAFTRTANIRIQEISKAFRASLKWLKT